MAELHDISEADYHADLISAETPTLSVSLANVLANKSPAHAYLEHPRLGGKPRTPTDDMERGSILHGLILDTPLDLVVVEEDAWRKSSAKEARDDARANGQIPILRHKYNGLLVTAERIRERIAELGLDIKGDAEQTVSWNEYVGATPVLCRCRIDLMQGQGTVLTDLKTTTSADPDTIARHMIDYGYAMQAAAYTRAVESLHPNLAGRVEFRFLFCEIEPPYCVTPAYCAGTMREIGEGRWQRAVETWERCLRTNEWPGYTRKPVAIEAPAWALAREMMMEDS